MSAQTDNHFQTKVTIYRPSPEEELLLKYRAHEDYYFTKNGFNRMFREKDHALAETGEHFSDPRTRSAQLYLQFSKLHTQLSDQYAQLAQNSIELTEQDELIATLQAQLAQEQPHAHIPQLTDPFYRL